MDEAQHYLAKAQENLAGVVNQWEAVQAVRPAQEFARQVEAHLLPRGEP